MSIYKKAIPALLLLILSEASTAQDDEYISLQSAIVIAEQNNPQLMAVHNEIDAAKGRGLTTWWLVDPVVSVEWEGVPKGSGLKDYSERRVTLSQRIEFPTNIIWRNRMAGGEVDVARMQYEESKLFIRTSVIVAYSQYLAARDGLSLAHERVALAQEFVDKAEFRHQVGEAPAIEKVRTHVELARAQNDLQNAVRSFKTAKAGFNIVLGRPPDIEIVTLDSLTYKPLDLSLTDIKEQMLVNHPRLHEASARVSVATNLRKLAWGTLLPAFKISGFQQNIGGNPDFYGVEIGLTVPLWFAFRQRGEIQHANAALASQENQLMQTRLQLLADVETAYASFEAAGGQLENYEHTLLNQADEVYRIALRSYEEGEVGYLQLLEAQQTLIEVRQGHIESLANYYTAIAALEKAGAVIVLE
jgi:cobalt-zinc-cadmium efflux system outer membrane protein